MIAVSIKWRERILQACIAGFVIYALFNILAMVYYPGGTSIDNNRVGYSFFENFFSDLGMVRTYSGESKPLSLFLFSSALVLIGVVLIVFFVLMAGYFDKSKLERYSSRIGSMAGVLAGVMCVGIAATPWDLRLNAHLVFIYCFSVAFLAVIVFYSAAILWSASYPNLYAGVFGIYMLVLVVYMVLMVFGPDIETPVGSRVMATGQKVTIYSGMLCLFIQILGAFFYNKRDDFRQAA